MPLDIVEKNNLDNLDFKGTEKIEILNKAFKSSVLPRGKFYESADRKIIDKVSNWVNPSEKAICKDSISISKGNVHQILRNMYLGCEASNSKIDVKLDGNIVKNVKIPGVATRGLKEISQMQINPEFRYQNICQQSGFAAEVISTAKENITAEMKNTGLKTYRADDLPDLFARNDQFVDKVRIDSQGKVVEKIQTKFVGKNGKECISKLMSKKYDKYYQEGKVDKIEIPKDYYDDAKISINNRLTRYEKQLERVRSAGKTEVTEAIENKIAKIHKIDSMLEQSNTNSYEARYARLHPNRYMGKLTGKGETTISKREMDFALKHEKIYNENMATGAELGVKTGLTAAGITAAISTVDNVGKYMDGKVSAKDTLTNIATETAKAGGIGVATGFVSGTVASAMSASSHKLINGLGQLGIPGSIVSFGVDCYDSVIDYAQGEIDGKELAYDLGESAVGIAGAATTGALVGSVIPGAGTVVGAAAGLVGSMVGYAVASEAYATAVEVGSKYVDRIGEKAQEVASATVERAAEFGTEVADTVTNAIKDFNIANALPFHI